MKLLAFSVFVAAAVQRAAGVEVTDGDELRAAIEDDTTTSIEIKINGNKPIRIDSTLEYTGDGPLTIEGQGKSRPAIIASGDFDLLKVESGLHIKNVDFQGPGGYSVMNRSTKDIPGKGIFVNIPTAATGVVTVKLEDVTVSGVANHGVHVSDCTTETCGNGNGGSGEGSAASVHVILKDVTVENVGQGKFDGDGVRVDERGVGDITFEAEGSTFKGCGADGVELDEGDEGDVIATVKDSSFMANGNYCYVPACIPAPDLVEDSVCLDAAGDEDPMCVEEGELDLDDGFDIDEAGPGDLYVTIENSSANDNFDEGFDFDEAGDGVLMAVFESVKANDNVNEGIKCSSEGTGTSNDIQVEVLDSTVNGNLDDGMQFESEGAGLITVVIKNTKSIDNRKNDLKVEQGQDAVAFNSDTNGSVSIDSKSRIGTTSFDNVDIVD